MAHNVFDQGARYVAKLDPHGMLCWLLGLRREGIAFRRWLDTRGIPFPGEPDYVCDTVAFVEDNLRGQVPWALILEFQLDPDPLMFGRFLVYGGQLWLEKKPSEERGDRFSIGTVVVNLRGKGTAARAMSWPEAGLLTLLQPHEVNLQDEDADSTIRAIEAREVTRTILPFIPLMQGGSDSAIIQRWLTAASAESDAKSRGDYGGLALIFAEAAGCCETWRQALKGWNMVQSQQVLEWQAEARAEGKAEGEFVGKLNSLLRILRVRFGPLPGESETRLLSVTDRQQLDSLLELAATSASLDDFRQRSGF